MRGYKFSAQSLVATSLICAIHCFGATNHTNAGESTNRLDANGLVRAMYNVGYVQTNIHDTDLAEAFLHLKREELGINDVRTEFYTVDWIKTEVGSHIRFHQTYEGIPVHNGEVILSTNANGQVGMVINNYRGNIRLSLSSPRIGETSAIAKLRATLPAQTHLIGRKEEAALMVWQDAENNYHLAYRVRMTTESPSGDWEAFIDANNGEVLHVENRFANSGEVHAQGSGYVYLTDPLSAAKKRYGASGFVDNNDGDTDSLAFYRSQVALDSLIYEDGVYRLKGPYCEIADIESPADPVYANSNKDGFKYTRSQQEFEAVNVYYHISKSSQYIKSLGFASVSLAAITVDPHGLNGEDNSHYSPNGNWIAFGEGGIDDAEDVDAILHEYAHAIVYNLCPAWGGGESGALGEGYSDYWAASYSRSVKGWSPACYEYNWVYNWNAHNMFQLGRSVNDSRTYPFPTTNVHDAGQIWSSALMAIWNDLGKEVTDKLVLKSLYYLGSGATGIDAAQALIQADRDLFSGAHIATLVYWLGTVKHFIEPVCYVPTITHTRLQNIPINAWPPLVAAQVSQNNPIEAVWVEYKIDADLVQGFALRGAVGGMYAAAFDIPASVLHVGDTVYYRISARYLGNRQGVATTPEANFFSFTITNPTTSVSEVSPNEFRLGQNYPNPFNPKTNISYSLAEKATVTLRIYDMLGQEVTTLVSDVQSHGTYAVSWNGTNSTGIPIASGSYFYRLHATTEAGKQISVQKRMVYIR